MTMPTQVNDKERGSSVLIFIWVGAFVLSNLRATMFWRLFVVGFEFDALPWVELTLWLVVCWFALRSLRQEGNFGEYISYWRRHWIVGLFVAVALFSIAWSIAPEVTLYRSLALLFTTLIASWMGYRYSIREIAGSLYHFGAYLMLVSGVVSLLIPSAGVMLNEPYTGSWRGIFWHKNHLGAVIPFFTLLYLLNFVENYSTKKWSYLARDLVFYVLSLGLSVMSRSAAALILLIIMHVLIVVAYIWLKVHARMKPIHYYVLCGLGMAVGLVVLSNLDFVFGLFNRTPTLTGRVPLWNYLLFDVVKGNPWVGYGFGALWATESFRIGVQQLLGWRYQVVIGDNGFLDILLHVGVIGFVPFFATLSVYFFRSVRYALLQRNLLGLLPLFLFIYAVFANISFSLFLETETFLWLMIIAALFAIARD